MAADDKKIIFSMVGVSKAFTPNKNVLKDITCRFSMERKSVLSV